MKTYTTLREIREKQPCTSGWKTLITALGDGQGLDGELSFEKILETNGISDAIWCLRTLDFESFCLFLADVAELAIPLIPPETVNNSNLSECISKAREFKAGKLSIKEFRWFRLKEDSSNTPMLDQVAPIYQTTAFIVVNSYVALLRAKEGTLSEIQAWESLRPLFLKHFCEN